MGTKLSQLNKITILITLFIFVALIVREIWPTLWSLESPLHMWALAEFTPPNIGLRCPYFSIVSALHCDSLGL